ncbi:hypothetical protein ACFPK9_00680 [Rubritalea spongiae]|uniref:Uncharacterized protein n=1 Tax=Rubritalea spongiae TaxID=430797 RepID=A0ABW5E5T1_9BACT
MLKVLLTFFLITFTSLQGEDLWINGRITPDQPFKAKVIGIQPGWGWDTIILQEIDGEKRYCLATFGNPNGTYQIIAPNNFKKDSYIDKGATFLEPSVDVSRFSWSMSIWKHGKIFGEKDTATKHYK